MPIFAIIRQSAAENNSVIATRISKKFPNNNYQLGRGQWLVSADSTAKDICSELGIEQGAHYGNTLVVEIASYYGLHNKKLWSWIKEREQ